MEGTLGELDTLLRGLAASLRRSDAVPLLPSAGPDVLRDLPVLGVFSILLFMFDWGVRLLLMQSIRRFTSIKPQNVHKCVQSIMEAFFYGAFTCIGLTVVPSLSWSWPSERWWAGYADGRLVMRNDVRCYYILYASRYAQMSVSLLFLEKRRKDFLQMLIHHVVTLLLTALSYTFGFYRVGAVIMVLMDPADVPLHIAKVCNYFAKAGGRRRRWKFLANRFFEAFVVVFLVTRILMFSYVVWSISVESHRHIPNWGSWPGVSMASMALSWALLAIQVLWFFLILKVAARVLSGQDVEDVRSDDDDDDDDDGQPECNGGRSGEGKAASNSEGVAATSCKPPGKKKSQ